MRKPKFIMLVGLPGSGKSKYSEQQFGYEILSSDKLREELFGDVNNQENNGQVFEQMNRRAVSFLKEGKDVIFDATNISSKRRMNFLKHTLKGIDCEKICVYICTSWIKCVQNDAKRERTVGIEVIERMKNQMQIPMFHEGWDDIRIVYELDTVEDVMRGFILKDFMRIDDYTYEDYINMLKLHYITERSIEMPQDNPHHSFSVSRHMYHTYLGLKDKGDFRLLMAGLLHDIGKACCKKFHDDGYAHYYGHDGLSAQLAIEFLKQNTRYSDYTIIRIATLIQLHMRMFDQASIPSIKERLEDELFFELELLHEADMKAK